MKARLIRTFDATALAVAMVFYPILSVTWYRSCKSYGDKDSRKFFRYGILGSIGILAIAATFFMPSPWKYFIFVFTSIPYLVCLDRQFRLILKKRRDSDLVAD